MKKSKIKILLLMFFAFLLPLQGCIQPGTPEDTDTEEENPGKTYVGCYETAEYVYQSDVTESCLTTDLSAEYLLLMNKEQTLGADYIPASLTYLTCPTTKSIQLETRAAQALYEMFKEMDAAGVDDVWVTSAYRSFEYQSGLFNYYISLETNHYANNGDFSTDAYACLGAEYLRVNYLDAGITRLSTADARRVVLSYSAEPGTSEHQTGLCVDFITSGMNGSLTVAFENTEAFAWLKENAYKFGYILRYPKGKEDITGYTYEPWHYRFVGREAATDIHFGNLTLEEYLQLAGA